MESLQSRFVKNALRLTRRKKSVGRVQELIENNIKSERLDDQPSPKVYEKHCAAVFTVTTAARKYLVANVIGE